MASRVWSPSPERLEWLEADGLGGFASGTADGIRTRRYHGLLAVPATGSAGRQMLVNGFEAWVETPGGRTALTSQRYGGEVVYPDGADRITRFACDRWPRWHLTLPDGTRLEHEVVVPRGSPSVVLSWRKVGGRVPARLVVRPLLSGRDIHALHHENDVFGFAAETGGARVVWRPYPGVPAIVSLSNATYRHAPEWYRNFLYTEERNRGLECTEDLASPGELSWDLGREDAVWLLTVEGSLVADDGREPVALTRALRAAEGRRRSRSGTALDRAAEAYLIRRDNLPTVIAGYPWFTDWGRDTFIALRGLCLATGRYADAGGILLTWADSLSAGMLPNRFVDQGGQPEYNSVDASLWFAVAAGELLAAEERGEAMLRRRDRDRLDAAVDAILTGYTAGTRYGIRVDDDGLVAAGEPGTQLTWMDARVDGRAVTPRVGKPVEVQALWLNGLHLAAAHADRWRAPLARGLEAFERRFWNPERGCLFDVVDVDHVAGRLDPALRPNQILAVGGLPRGLLGDERAARVVAVVEERLLTPVGLRSLAPGEPGYAGRYSGGPAERDRVYHQGTVWPWLLGPFVEAWVRVHGASPGARRWARRAFLSPLLAALDPAGLGHLPEIADGDPPHTPRGCPFQAWSLGEALRLDRSVLATRATTRRTRR
ncbi:MAG: amylo-alpha-1,6-glucosidase [Acidobacteriota bacterium]